MKPILSRISLAAIVAAASALAACDRREEVTPSVADAASDAAAVGYNDDGALGVSGQGLGSTTVPDTTAGVTNDTTLGSGSTATDPTAGSTLDQNPPAAGMNNNNMGGTGAAAGTGSGAGNGVGGTTSGSAGMGGTSGTTGNTGNTGTAP